MWQVRRDCRLIAGREEGQLLDDEEEWRARLLTLEIRALRPGLCAAACQWRFAGQDGQAPTKFKVEAIDEDDVADRELDEHVDPRPA